jgi:hypothetical protein
VLVVSNGSAILFLALTLVVDLLVDAWWGGINGSTNYTGWSTETVLMYQHVLPLAISASFAGAVTGKAR